MPKVDGWQVIEHMRAKSIRIPVLVLSGKLEKDEVAKLLKSGTKTIVSKPVQKKRFFTKIDNLPSDSFSDTP